MDESREVAFRNQSENHLPSTEVREMMPEVEDEIHLKDYLDVILRRRWTVIITLLVTFFSVAVYTFSTTPIYKATGTIKASPKGLQVASFEDQSSSMLRSQEFLETQAQLLTSERVFNKMINTQNLENNPLFNPKLEKGEEGPFDFVKSILSSIKDMIRPASSEADQIISSDLQQIITYEGILKKLQQSITVAPQQNTQLIEVACESPDPELAAQLINTMMDQYLVTLMDNKIASFKTADVFLEKQIAESRIKLEKSEEKLNEYARKTGLLTMDTKVNLIMRQLEELNEALAKSVTKRL